MPIDPVDLPGERDFLADYIENQDIGFDAEVSFDMQWCPSVVTIGSVECEPLDEFVTDDAAVFLPQLRQPSGSVDAGVGEDLFGDFDEVLERCVDAVDRSLDVALER